MFQGLRHGLFILCRGIVTMPRKSSKKRAARVKELQAEYQKLAKTANRRMYKLEKLAEHPDYKAVLGYAYKDVAHELEIRGLGRRFPMSVARMSANKTDIRALKALINTLQDFLDAPSSTKRGIDKTYSRRAQSLNKQYGTDFTPENMRDFFEASVWKKINDRFGSKTAMRVIGAIQKNADTIIQEVNDARRRHKKINISSLMDIDGRNINEELTGRDKGIISKLAAIYRDKQ